jgi:ABC-type uncharacterized transport system substrate-binding protein
MRKILFLFLAVFSAAAGLSAHPHVKLTSHVEIVCSGNRCEGCRFEWKFDDFFSGSVIREFDKNKDGFFDAKEIKNIYNQAFINLKNYGYFVFLRKGFERKNPDKVTDFSAWQKNGVLYYSFFVPFEKLKYDDDFYVAVFDRSFYCAVVYTDKDVSVMQKSGEAPNYELSVNKKYPVYYNPLGSAEDLTIYKKWKPGLETAYPDEIHIHFKK